MNDEAYIESLYEDTPEPEDYDDDAELKYGLEYDGPLAEPPVIDILTKEALTRIGDEDPGADAAPDGVDGFGADGDDGFGAGGDDGSAADGNADEAIADLKSAEEEAYYTASLIKRYEGREYYDSKAECVKKLTLADIVVLSRTGRSYAATFFDVFRKCSIESRIADNEGYFDTIEIGVFMDLLSVIDNSRNDFPLISVMHSEIFGFSAEELGHPVYPPAQRELAAHGISCAGKTARQITKADYDRYDYIIGMDHSNMRNMQRAFGGDPAGKLSMLLDYTDRPGQVADPWYTGDFSATWRDVMDGCTALLEKIG